MKELSVQDVEFGNVHQNRNKKDIPQSDVVRMAVWNVCGLRSKQAELKEVVVKQKWDIVGVVETFMGSSEGGDMEGFVWFGVGGKKSGGLGRGSGGVGIFVAEYLAEYVEVE